MLDLSQSEVISRADLFEAPSVPATTPPTTLIKPSTFIWDLDFGDEVPADQPSSPKRAKLSASAEPDDEEAKEYLFKLFKTESAKAQTFVVPKSPSPILSKPAEEEVFEQVYFTDEQVEDARRRFRSIEYYIKPASKNESTSATAVSGDDVRLWSQTKWKACEKPWRVLHLKVVSKPRIALGPSVSNLTHGIPVDADAKKRHRPNKKRRIILRKKRAIVEEKRQKTEAKKAAKKKSKPPGKAGTDAPSRKLTEEEEKAKKTRLNRLKKVRRKMKLQAEKAQTAS